MLRAMSNKKPVTLYCQNCGKDTAGQSKTFYGNVVCSEACQKNLGERLYFRDTPLYPFGYGLSYTTFAFSNLKLSHPEIKVGAATDVSVDVRNTGNRSGDEVVQLYIHQQAGSASRPVRELKGFERVTLAPGETKTVHFKLGPEQLRYWNSAVRDWVQEAETFDVWAGNDSTAPLKATLKIIR